VVTLDSATDTSRQTLARILEITCRLGTTTEVDDLLNQIVDAALDLLQADRGTVFLYDSATRELYSKVATGTQEIRFPADRGLAGQTAQSLAVVNVPDCYADPRFNPEIDRETGYKTHCLLSVPLVGHDGALVGVMQLLNKRDDGPFDAADEQVALALAAQCAVALQRAFLIAEQLVKQKLQRDLALAREIQSRVLPRQLPVLGGYDLVGWSEPADETGGDIYDAVAVGDNEVAVVLADATGHGVGPAISVTQMRAMCRIAFRLGIGLDEVLRQVNEQLVEDLPANRFVTAFLGCVDATRHEVRYHAGGQGPLLHYQAAAEACTFHDASTFPLGILPDIPVDPAPPPIAMAPGDILALLSDGIYEYADAGGHQFGLEGVCNVVRTHHDQPMSDLLNHIRAAVGQHAAGAPQADDMTIVLIRRLP